MARDTKIEWAHDTVNFWWGCQEVSEACDLCYARELDARYRFGGAAHWGAAKDGVERWERVEKAAAELKKNNRLAIKTGERRRQFINSMSDFFEDREDLDPFRLAALDAFALADTLDILLLTKRPSRILPIFERMLRDARNAHRRSPGFDILTDWVVDGAAPANIWLGTTCENQKWLELRLPHLLHVPAAVRFISAEPLLGGLDLMAAFNAWWNEPQGTGPQTWPAMKDYLHWVICGGESDWKRPSRAPGMHSGWARDLRNECQAANIAFHFKQWGDWLPFGQFYLSQQHRIGDWPHFNLPYRSENGTHQFVEAQYRTGKKLAGRLLDGREWNEFPKVQIA